MLNIQQDCQKSQNIEYKNKLFLLLEKFALEHKPVNLASGLLSNIYLDCRQVYFRGDAQFFLGELFYEYLINYEKKHNIKFCGCGGMALGAVPLACALSSAAFRRGRDLFGFTVRKEPKSHGTKISLEGSKNLKRGENLLLLEDVVTTGNSALQAVHKLREAGFIVSHMVAIVDRQKQNNNIILECGVNFSSVFKLENFIK